MTSFTAKQTQFIESVLAVSPKIAAFDCDGTLWSGDAGEGFFRWEMEQGLVSRKIADWATARYADYRAGKVPEDVMCGEMITPMHAGMREDEIQKACDRYFGLGIEKSIFPEMRELVRRLHDQGCDVWVVSSSSFWVIKSAMQRFGIAPNRILATEAVIENGIVADRLVRIPSGHGKVVALKSVLRTAPDCAFGNAIWDREMLSLAKHAFVINPNPNLREVAQAKGWPVYQPEISQSHH